MILLRQRAYSTAGAKIAKNAGSILKGSNGGLVINPEGAAARLRDASRKYGKRAMQMYPEEVSMLRAGRRLK